MSLASPMWRRLHGLTLWNWLPVLGSHDYKSFEAL
jgi:hypothetical protein